MSKAQSQVCLSKQQTFRRGQRLLYHKLSRGRSSALKQHTLCATSLSLCFYWTPIGNFYEHAEGRTEEVKTTEFLFSTLTHWYPLLEECQQTLKGNSGWRTPESLITKYGHKHMPNGTKTPETMSASEPFFKMTFIILVIWMCVLCVSVCLWVQVLVKSKRKYLIWWNNRKSWAAWHGF